MVTDRGPGWVGVTLCQLVRIGGVEVR
jgi:hypothetical protein